MQIGIKTATIENIYIFEMQDAVVGGIIVANNQDDAWNKLAAEDAMWNH